MKNLTTIQLVAEHARIAKKPCIYISFDTNLPPHEVIGAAPVLDFWADREIFERGKGIIVCEDDEEMQTIFEDIVGDDGSDTNLYEGTARVYALTFNDKGEIETENT